MGERKLRNPIGDKEVELKMGMQVDGEVNTTRVKEHERKTK